MRISVMTAVLSTAILAGVSAAQTAPATRPAATAAAQTKPARVASFADPRSAIVSFVTAEDEAGLREALIIGPEHRAEIDALVGVMGAQLRLQKAAVAQYGTEGEKEFGTNKDKLEATLKSVQAAQIVMDPGGAAAVVTLARDDAARQNGGNFMLKKVDGNWKLDAASVFEINGLTPESLAGKVKVGAAVKRVTEQAITDIGARKYNSAKDASVDYWKQSVEAVRQTIPATAPR